MKTQTTTPPPSAAPQPGNCCLTSVRDRTAVWTNGPTERTSTITCPVCGYSWTEQIASVYDTLSPIDPRD